MRKTSISRASRGALASSSVPCITRLCAPMEALRSDIFASALLFCLLVSACDQFSNSDAALRRRLNDTEEKLTKTENDVATLREQVTDLKQKRDWDDISKDWDKIAYLTPGAEGYSTVGFDLGVLTIQLSDVQPYANGCKVTLTFGNTLSSSIDGLQATIEWGRVNNKGVADNKSAKSKDMTFTQALRGGAWTPISVVLEGIPPAELGFVRVSKVRHTGIHLAAPKAR
jgi:Protein of unknown function (DUF3251)